MTTKRHLITTADQRTWKRDRPVLFLGEWCQLYDAKAAWSGMDAVVAAPYGIGVEQKARDRAYIYEDLLPRLQREVAAALNAYHKRQHSVRYWQIVVGPWLQNYVQTLFNRYFTLEQALKSHEVSGTTVLDAPAYCLATLDAIAFVWASNDDVWNHVLYSRLIRERREIAVDVDSSALHGARCFTDAAAQPASRRGIRGVIMRAANTILPFFVRKHDALIINSYLPRRVDIGLQLLLGQCPQMWVSPAPTDVWPDPELRKTLSLDASGHQGFERFVRTQLFDAIPSCYLEGYPQLLEQARAVLWPREPKFIYTANNFAYDEVFKVYAGLKAEQRVPYFVGAHGNHGATPYLEDTTDSPEVQSSDKYFTWSWANGDPHIIPAFPFTTAARKPRPIGPHPGGLLLIEVFVTQRKTHWDSYYEHGLYQEDQFLFVEALPAAIREQLTVRLHSSHKRSRWSDEQRWRGRSPATRLETGERYIRDLTAESRLVVHSYNSTGLPETLALNIPTMCFWNGGLNDLSPSHRPYYELLRDAGILADSPKQAAALISLRWDHVSEWWGSEQVQAARSSFCAHLCRTEPKPARTMKRLLLEACASTKSGGKHERPPPVTAHIHQADTQE